MSRLDREPAISEANAYGDFWVETAEKFDGKLA